MAMQGFDHRNACVTGRPAHQRIESACQQCYGNDVSRVLGQPHIIVMVKAWELNKGLVVGAPTLAGAAPGTLSTN
jgi:hypothetical protein